LFVVYQWWNDGIEVLQMEIFLPTKFIGEDVDENLEIFRSFGEVLHQIGDHVVQMSAECKDSRCKGDPSRVSAYFDALIVSAGRFAFRVYSSKEMMLSKSGTNRIELEHVFKPPERIIRT
jgi:hypothetical protein